MKTVHIYTDGACRGNPGPGGWGVVLKFLHHERKVSGGVKETTNNRMELLAAIKALELLNEPCKVNLYTDSKYLRDGVTKWMMNWKKNNWRTANKIAVKNKDLWVKLDESIGGHRVNWHWVKGHSGHPENELADELARDAVPL